jgi:hypothetical protein
MGMKRLTLAFIATLIATAIFMPTTAQARCDLFCVTTRIESLKIQINGLKRQVKQARREANQAEQHAAANDKTLSCIGTSTVTEYGDRSGTFGYQFDPPPVAPMIHTSALDFTHVGSVVDEYLLRDRCGIFPLPVIFAR